MAIELTQRDARKVFLSQQGLLKQASFGKGTRAVARAINRMGYLQIDTISVINRAHHHIMHTRIPGYHPDHLDQLMASREIYEYWGHAAAFLPFEHYRFSLPVMQGWKASRERDEKLARSIIERIRADGPLQSRDFEDSRKDKGNGWWDWKPAKKVLEHLFLSGDLMISHRSGFQKVYDLPENILPADTITTHPSSSEWARHIVLTMLSALGVATEMDIGYAKSTYQRLAKVSLRQPIKDAIKDLLSNGEIVEVRVEGLTCYALPEVLSQLPLRTNRQRVSFLSPFDNLVINRKRVIELFNFDYQLECYVPEAKRKYGYFALPILLGDELIGRADMKADRKSLRLIVQNLVLDENHKIDDNLPALLAGGLSDFCAENGCSSWEIVSSEPARLKNAVMIHR